MVSQIFKLIRELGANLVRVYSVPGQWFLDLAGTQGLKVLVDVAWNQHVCFLDSAGDREQARQAVRSAVVLCQRHPAVFAFSVGNEISPDIVRWSGARAVADFIDELVGEAKRIDPDCLCTYTNFPPTEFLRPASVDFTCFNVYLNQENAFAGYLARLQMISGSKPLVLGELGVDSLREGEARKSELLSRQIESAFRGGAAGTVVFSFTDDWWRSGQQIEAWQMGLTTRQRQPKNSFYAVQRAFGTAPQLPLARSPRVSVVVASYNGERTLNACLNSLEELDYPDFEVILVDDGSNDATPEIARLHPKARYLRHQKNLGLSAARNTGIAAATGEIVAFTDSDCRADENWLNYLAGDLVSTLSTIVIDPPEGNMAVYLASLERLRALAPRTIYPAHGGPAPDGVRTLDAYLAHRREREAKVLAALHRAGTLGEVTARAYDDTPPGIHRIAARSCLASLEELEAEGLARRDGALWRAA